MVKATVTSTVIKQHTLLTMKVNIPQNESPTEGTRIRPWQEYPKSPWVFDISPSQFEPGGEIKRLSVKVRNKPEIDTAFYRFDRDFVKEKLIQFWLLPLFPAMPYSEIIALFHEAANDLYSHSTEFQEYLPSPKVEALDFCGKIDQEVRQNDV